MTAFEESRALAFLVGESAICGDFDYSAKMRAITVDDVRNLVSVHNFPGKLGFYKALHRENFTVLSKVT